MMTKKTIFSGLLLIFCFLPVFSLEPERKISSLDPLALPPGTKREVPKLVPFPSCVYSAGMGFYQNSEAAIKSAFDFNVILRINSLFRARKNAYSGFLLAGDLGYHLVSHPKVYNYLGMGASAGFMINSVFLMRYNPRLLIGGRVSDFHIGTRQSLCIEPLAGFLSIEGGMDLVYSSQSAEWQKRGFIHLGIDIVTPWLLIRTGSYTETAGSPAKVEESTESSQSKTNN